MDTFAKINAKPAADEPRADGTYFVGENYIAIYTCKFSDYAIAYTEKTNESNNGGNTTPGTPNTPTTPATPSTPSNSSGGGGGASTSNISVSAAQNGKVSVSPKNAAKGATVTIALTPNAGYTGDSLKVTDAAGNEIKLTKISDTQYTFVQPNGKVKIEATFAVAESPAEETDDKTDEKADDKTTGTMDFGYADCNGVNCLLAAFADVDADAWYHDGVHFCLNNGLMSGYDAVHFAPGDTTSRAQIVMILWRLAGSPTADADVAFGDAQDGAWYMQAIRWAAVEGIVSGYQNGDFGVNDAITREQMATILYRFAQKMGYDVTARGDISAFPDAAEVSTYAKEAMAWAYGAGILSGVQQGNSVTLSPVGDTSRAQVASMLLRFCKAFCA